MLGPLSNKVPAGKVSRWIKRSMKMRLVERFTRSLSHLEGESEISAGINVPDVGYRSNLAAYTTQNLEPVPPTFQRVQIEELLADAGIVSELEMIARAHGVLGTFSRERLALEDPREARRRAARAAREPRRIQPLHNPDFGSRIMWSAFLRAVEHRYGVLPVTTGLELIPSARKIDNRELWHSLPEGIKRFWEDLRFTRNRFQDSVRLEEIILSRT